MILFSTGLRTIREGKFNVSLLSKPAPGEERFND